MQVNLAGKPSGKNRLQESDHRCPTMTERHAYRPGGPGQEKREMEKEVERTRDEKLEIAARLLVFELKEWIQAMG